jgi:predicted ATPase
VADVAISLLGDFSVSVDGVAVDERAWRLKKARELVKLLALAPGHRLHREQAMDVLWRDRDPAAAANNLHQAVHVARRVLGADAIEVRDETLRLVADVDVDRLEDAAREARRVGTPAAYRAALELSAGELLPENRYDDWAIGRRDELAELHDELAGAAGRAPSGGRVAGALPAEASSFVGRRHELGELRALLGRTRLLTLTGPGGVGKSRLALELARGAEREYADGAALVELAAVSDPRRVPGAAAAALDVHGLPGQPLVDALLEFLAPRPLLLVLDNCEHVLAASAALADALLRGATGLTILATSREPLRIAGEVVFRVPSLGIPDPERTLDPDALFGFEAVRLFVERAASAAPGFELDAENAADVARICFRLDGLPLALELAAGRLGALGPAALAARLDDRFRLLRGGGAAPTRQQTLAATLQWSHDLLEPDERTLLRRLAVFSGGFDLGAVEEVCAAGELEPADVADALARLVEKSLVAADETGGDRRYRLLETVRLYAAERLAEASESGALADRHAAWALAFAERESGSTRLDPEAANLRAAHDRLLAHAPTEALRLAAALWPFWLRRIDLAEARDRLAASLAAAPARTALRAESLIAAAAVDVRSGSLVHGASYALESLEIAAELGDGRAEWRALQALGEQLGILPDSNEESERWFARSIEVARREGFRAGEAVGVYSLGVARATIGDLAGADELFERSLATFRELAGSGERIPSLVNVAEMPAGGTGLRPAMWIVFEDTLLPFAEISCEAAAGYVLANRAGIARRLGDADRAHALLDESAAIFAREADDRGRATVLIRRAYLELSGGDPDAARTGFEEGLALRRRLNDRRGIGLALCGLGLIETSVGRFDEAGRVLGEALALFRRAGDRWGLASALWRTADLEVARGRLDEAEAALLEARSVIGETQRARWDAHTVAGLAEVALLRGDEERAAVLFAEARDRYASKQDALAVETIEDRLATLR